LVLAAAAVCAWLVAVPFLFGLSQPLFMVGPIVGVPMLPFPILGLLMVLRFLFDRNPGLVLNRRGLVDNASGIAAGFVAWSEITGMVKGQVRSTTSARYLSIYVSQPRRFLERGGWLKRRMVRWNLRTTGTPVHLTSLTLRIRFDDLVALVDRYARRYAAADAQLVPGVREFGF
jgi:hypothetical protein